MKNAFFSQPSLTLSPSYGSAQAWCPFLSAWLNKQRLQHISKRKVCGAHGPVLLQRVRTRKWLKFVEILYLLLQSPLVNLVRRYVHMIYQNFHNFSSEEEVLLPVGISFQILSVYQNTHQKNIIEINEI